MRTTLFSIAVSSASQVSGERSALKDALVEFLAHSKGSSGILRLLNRKKKPVGYKALMDEIRFAERRSPDHHELPAAAIRAVLCATQAAGFVRLTQDGFSITELGREAHAASKP